MKNKKTIIAIVSAIVLIAIIAIVAIIIMKNNKKYTITFDTQGGNTIEAIEVKANETLVLPKNPEKEGYIFLHWVDEEDKPVSNNFKVTKDMKLIAKWAEPTQEVVTVSFNTDGGNTISSITVIKGEKITLPENPTKEGYNFKEWVYENGEQFKTEAIIEENITLKAIWEKVEENKKETNKNNTTSKPSEGNQNEQPTTTPTPENQNVEVTDISLNKNSLGLIIGNSDTLTANITPSNATNKSVTWSSSNSSIISVDNSGKVTAKAIGSATITAKTANGKEAIATVTSDVKNITLTVGNQTISKYGTITSTNITVNIDANGYNVPDSLITWSAPDTSGYTAPAYMSLNGKTATVTARDVWSGTASVPITVKINNKQVKTTIYVESAINISNLSNGINSYERDGKLYCTFSGEKSLHLQSNIDVTWQYSKSSPVIAGIVGEDNRNLKLSVQYVSQNGLNIKARSKAGQIKEIILTPMP
jgi:hypothetical protein